MEKFISVFDMFKIGVGPSSSHTLGPWKAALKCMHQIQISAGIQSINAIQIKLYGSLAKTGKGHGTDMAVLMGLLGEDPITTDTSLILDKIEAIKKNAIIALNNTEHKIVFNYESNLLFLKDQSLPHHPNALQFIVTINGTDKTFTYYSIGGGFIEEDANASDAENKVNASDAGKEEALASDARKEATEVPFDFYTTDELLHWCMKTGMSISDVVLENEKTIFEEAKINMQLDAIWDTMLNCMYKGCLTEGILPGGLQVRRRAYDLNKQLTKNAPFNNVSEWMDLVKNGGQDFRYILDCVSCFALAVNEENASFGRVVTAPTNGAAGVVPAVLMYAQLFCNKNTNIDTRKFLMTASAVGILFKSGATISAAMGGCQAEIGVSSAMAAAALTELLGGNQKQCLMAAEIAMEHHLGLTCDPIGGLVQIPCIERNSMGAIKAITAAQLALQSKPDFAVVSLDKVIKTMWNTALDMSVKYKETADGGLAIQIPIALAEC
jgi:L-serine dehydratase